MGLTMNGGYAIHHVFRISLFGEFLQQDFIATGIRNSRLHMQPGLRIVTTSASCLPALDAAALTTVVQT
jgi:hypothetical protein